MNFITKFIIQNQFFRVRFPTSMEELDHPADGRLFSVAVNDDLTINLFPFILFVKLAFILGKK